MFTSSFPGLPIIISSDLITRDSNWHHCSPTKPSQFSYRSKAEKQFFLLASFLTPLNRIRNSQSTTKDLQPVIHDWIIAAYRTYIRGRAWSSYFPKNSLEFDFFSYVPDGILTSFFFYPMRLDDAHRVEINWKSQSISLALEKSARLNCTWGRAH